MNLRIRKLFFNDTAIKTFFITRLHDDQVLERVFLKKGRLKIDVTRHHSMICLDPFCVAAWISAEHVTSPDLEKASLIFFKGQTRNASINLSLIERIPTEHGILLLYKIENVKNHQLTILHRLVLFAYFLRSKANTYYSRKVISALYSYPRKIIIVSYEDEAYYNIFPMDIQGFIEEDDIYTLGLRTTNATLNKILEAKKVVVCDTDAVDINTIYNLGRHSSIAPISKDDLPFGTSESELFGFPVPDFTGSYKEIEIVQHKKMGYHMLMIGKVVNSKKIKSKTSSLYHVGFLQFQKSNYQNIEGLF